MSNPNDWLHIYQRNHNLTRDDQQQQQPIHPTTHHQGTFGRHDAVSSIPDAPFVTTNVTNSAPIFFSNSTDQMNLMGINSSSSTHLNPEGRVSKPIRRRRASRGAPVTFLNTDASNFRAMVQQFTGVVNPPFSLSSNNIYNPRSDVLGTNLSSDLPQRRDSWFQHQDPSSSSSVMQQQQQQYMFGLNNNNSTVTTTGREGSNHQDQQLLNNPILPNSE